MSANQKRRATTPRQRSSSEPSSATPLEKQLKREVTAAMKQRLGLAENENVPAKIQEIVDSAAREIAESSIANAVIQEVESVARRLGRNPEHVRNGARAVRTSDLPLLQEAEYLAAKKKALQATGFSSEEAMRILVAEVSGGEALRR
jgi:hypothetical protein